MSVYDPLNRFLSAHNGKSVQLSFAQIETILNRDLPAAAREHDWWWANEDVSITRHVQCRSWQNAGFQAGVNRVQGTVRFSR